MPTSTVEDYLKVILHAQGPGEDLVSMGRVAADLGVAPGTVTAMVKTLADSGLVVYEPYSGVRLSPAGRQLAAHVLRRHRLIELFLVEVLGLDWSEVHAEAEQLEHAVSDRIIERIDEMLGRPAVDPHGDPIPSRHGELAETDYPSLATCAVDQPLRVARITDQSAEFLRLVEREGLRPGAEIAVSHRDELADAVTVRRPDGGTVSLGSRVAARIQVEGPREG
jgi:DtxR family Mn-dependent transcriptional regulator